jgi:hypothetical protein
MFEKPSYKLVFMANADLRIIVVRPVGPMPGSDFVEQLFEAYAGVEAPWTYNRLTDFRRFNGYISQADLENIARRWKDLAAGHAYHARVAVLSEDRHDRIRVPAASPMFPNETICLFNDFHEAMGWLKGIDAPVVGQTLRAEP